MKIHRALFVGLVAAFAVSLASTAVSAVAAETPFKGTFSGVETDQLVFPILSVSREARAPPRISASTRSTRPSKSMFGRGLQQGRQRSLRRTATP